MTHINGVGTSLFGKQPEVPLPALVESAVIEAINDAGTDEFDAVYFGSVYGEMGVAQRALHRLGIYGIPVVRVENACASATTAFSEAHAAVEFGRYKRVLAVGAEHMTSRFDGPIEPGFEDVEARAGLPLPGIYALAASRYQAVHGLTDDQLAAVAVKNRGNGVHNDRAQKRQAVTISEVLESRLICDPLTLFQCSPISDGAAAAVIGSDRSEGSVEVRSSLLRTGGLRDQRSDRVWGFDLVADTARMAYAQAGIDDPRSVDVFEVHDAFTIGEIVTIEALGLAPLGEGGKLTEAGDFDLTGEVPVNPSGGLLSRGHPIGATGIAQIAEIVWQLRGIAGDRQILGAQLGVVETMGGGVAGVDGNACVITVLEGAK